MNRELRKGSGLFLALLAFVAQLTISYGVPPSMVSLANMTALCHHGSHSDGPPAPVRPMPGCQHCFSCHSAAGPAGLVTAAPMLSRSGLVQIARSVSMPPAAAPPMRYVTDARPRGPPILI
jgi:hypothetical protein